MEYNEGVDGRRLREDGLMIALDVEVCVCMFFLPLNWFVCMFDVAASVSFRNQIGSKHV